MPNFVIKGDICYSESPQALRSMQNGYLVCLDGLSAGTWEALPAEYQGLPMVDHTGKLILPGLVDLHMHAPQFTYCGLGMDLELLDWLRINTFPEESRFCDLDHAARSYDIVIANLVRGPNTRAVMFATAHTEATVLLMDKMEQSGLVSYVGRVNMDRDAPDSLREKDAETSLRHTREWLSRTQHAYQNTTPILTPRFIPSCSDALLRGLGALQSEAGIALQSHLSENLTEIDLVKKLCPGSRNYTDAYRRFGMLQGLPTIMAHCVWSDEEETRILKDSGTYVAHCPQSNTNIASGIAPIRRFLREGLRVGLGSDVAGGSHTSIFRAMTDAIQVSKLRWRLVDQEYPGLTLPEAFYLATVGGGEFFGKVGSFAAGYELDALIIDDAGLPTTRELTLEDRLARVAYLSDDRHIVSKYVRGKQLF